MVNIGDNLASPEAGWKRYNYHNSNAHIHYDKIQYSPTHKGWLTDRYDGNPKNIRIMSFKFTGSKLRLITYAGSDRATDVKVVIDGKSYIYSQQSRGYISCMLAFDMQNLGYKEHIVELYSGTNGYYSNFTISGIDIEDGYRLFHPQEVLGIESLTIGKFIRCNYVSSNGEVGYFNNLGQETSDFIDTKKINTSDGDFNFIHVGYDHKNRIKLVADRNIQCNISWDSLNEEGLITENRINIDYNKVYLNPTTLTSGILSDKLLSFTSSTNTSEVKASEGKHSGKWYWEVTKISGGNIARFNGICSENRVTGNGYNDAIFLYAYDGSIYVNGSSTNFIDAHNNVGTVLGFALDLDNNTLDIYINGVFKRKLSHSIDMLSRPIYPIALSGTYNGGVKWRHAFSKKDFKYMPPSGYLPYEHDEDKYKSESSIRLLSGGISSNDKDNEWDKIIVESSLNGAIVPGDKSIWNWGLHSWTSTIGSNLSNRVYRGKVKADYHSEASASTHEGADLGFRPVLLVESRYRITDINTLLIMENNLYYIPYKKFYNENTMKFIPFSLQEALKTLKEENITVKPHQLNTKIKTQNEYFHPLEKFNKPQLVSMNTRQNRSYKNKFTLKFDNNNYNKTLIKSLEQISFKSGEKYKIAYDNSSSKLGIFYDNKLHDKSFNPILETQIRDRGFNTKDITNLDITKGLFNDHDINFFINFIESSARVSSIKIYRKVANNLAKINSNDFVFYNFPKDNKIKILFNKAFDEVIINKIKFNPIELSTSLETF